MSWLGPKLEPGEVLCERYPRRNRRLAWATLLMGVAVFINMGARTFLDFSWSLALAAIPIGISAMFLFSGLARRRVFVTNRRLLVRNKVSRGHLDEIPIAEIESVHHDVAANTFVIRGGEREISIDADLIPADALQEAIACAKGTAA